MFRAPAERTSRTTSGSRPTGWEAMLYAAACGFTTQGKLRTTAQCVWYRFHV